MEGPGLLKDGWFREENDMWPGIAQGLKVDQVLFNEKNEFQHLTVFESDPRGPWGTVMTLDGCVQFTDYDEFTYHEMLGHLSCCSHAAPKRVLIIGGGDGGVVREILRHKTRSSGSEGVIDTHEDLIQSIELVDIDGRVIEQSKLHFPQIACGYADTETVHVTVGDGVDFVVNKAKDNTYDIIVVDTTDPEGPASELFGELFYSNIMRILTPNGIVCNQGESIWLHRPLIESMLDFLRNKIGFAQVLYATIQIPTYPGGSIGTLLCCKSDVAPDGSMINLREPVRPVETLPFAKELKYYSSDIHRSCFVLPQFVRYLNHPEEEEEKKKE